MNAHHTPGPWSIAPRKNVWRNITTQAGEYVAEVETDPDAPDESEANARLIAAAPELLDVLRDVRDQRAPLSVMMARIEAVIAKAEGK